MPRAASNQANLCGAYSELNAEGPNDLQKVEEDSYRLRREIKIFHQNGHTIDELALYTPTVKKNVLEIMKIMVSLAHRVRTGLYEATKAYAQLLAER